MLGLYLLTNQTLGDMFRYLAFHPGPPIHTAQFVIHLRNIRVRRVSGVVHLIQNLSPQDIISRDTYLTLKFHGFSLL